MTCDYCTEAEASPHCAKFRGDCLECAARMLAGSPQHFIARQSQSMTPDYRGALQRVFGADWQDGHRRVKAWADKMGSA